MLRLAAAIVCVLFVGPAQATEAGWALLREGGQVVLIRHAFAAGANDSKGFAISDCATQRNLTDRGKQQAERIGALMAARAERIERVVSSRYCRCLETARIAFEDKNVEVSAALDVPPAEPAAQRAALDEILMQVGDFSGSGNLIMVTHLETIRLLTGVSPREGEAVIVRPEGDHLHVMGRVIFN